MDTKGIGVVLVLLFLALFGVFPAVTVLDHNSSVQHNEPTMATVTGVDIADRSTDDGREYRPVVSYEYVVDGETYESSNVHPGQFTRWYGGRSAASDITDRYAAGASTVQSGPDARQPVTVYYNPESPGEAYLYNNGWPDGWYFGAGYVLVAIFGGLYLIRQGFRRWRQRTLIRDTPTENAQSLSIGPSEIKGEAVTGEDEPMSAPFSDEDCVLAKYEVEEYDDDNDDSGGSWQTRESGVWHTPFGVDDGTGAVQVRPHDDATYDLDPNDWSETYVNSSRRGPEPVQEFVAQHDDLGYPADMGGKDNDRKYRQNLIRPEEPVYVFGTVQPRENASPGADNADRLVVEKVEDGSMQEPMFMISDDQEQDLIERRKWALWRGPVGGFFLTVAFVITLFMFGPFVGLEMPRLFEGFIGSVS